MASTQDLIRRGVTSRQITHWVLRGWLRPDNPNPGTGVPLTFPHAELRIAEVMLTLVDAGMRPEDAHRIARAPVAGADRLRRLADLVEGGVLVGGAV